MSKLKIYKASAGSGKTYTLALEYIRELLTAPTAEHYRHILAVTFTKDATGEMKDRILAELYGLAFNTDDSAGFLKSLQEKLELEQNSSIRHCECNEAIKASTTNTGLLHSVRNDGWSEEQIRKKSEQVLHAILHDYSRLNITTIDSFFQKVLRNLARELGRGSKFNLEMNTQKVLREAVHATIEKSNTNKQVLDWLTTYIEQKMDEDRNWRIEEDIFEFSHCVYNEFFQEHEKELRKQLNENPHLFVQLRTQQNAVQKDCKAVLKQIMEKSNRILDERLLTLDYFGNSKHGINFITKLGNGDFSATMGSYVGKCRADAEFWGKAKHPRKPEIIALAASDWMPMLDEAIATLRIYQTSRMITGNLHQLGLIWNITQEIDEQNAENSRFMLANTARFLNEMIDDSDAPFIYEKLGSDIRHVMIDEFQDTSRLQWKNFKALLSNILANDDYSLLVGDVKQSIYRWRNGDWTILNNIGRELQATVQSLAYNYRSEKIIVDFNNQFFVAAAKMLNDLFDVQFEKNAGNSPFRSTYNADDVVQKTLKTSDNGFVSIDFIHAQDTELSHSELMQEAVFEQLQKLQQSGIPAKDICLLLRNNKEIIVLAEYLASRKNEYPEMSAYLNVISNEAFQLQSSLAVNILIEGLKIVANPEDEIARAVLDSLMDRHCEGLPEAIQTVEYTTFGVGSSLRHSISKAPALPQAGRLAFSSDVGWSLRRTEEQLLYLQKMPLFEQIGALYRRFHLEQITGQSAYLFAFYDQVSKYLKDRPADLPSFLNYWEEELKKQSIPAGSEVDGVRAMTIHKSKGLQFPTVIIPYCDWKIDPKANQTTVWCEAKDGFYDLSLLPVSYNSTMGDTVFAPEYELETSQSWMDNLNLLYVAFTRAEQNLILLGKYKKKLETVEDIKTVSDLLQLSVEQLAGNWSAENLHFDLGTLQARRGNPCGCPPENERINVLKLSPTPMNVSFVLEEFQRGKAIFKQSNQSREFVAAPAPPLKRGGSGERLYGNTMHYLFEQITTFDAIEKAIDNGIVQGLIVPEEKENYARKIRSAIEESHAENWFSGQYKSYQEHSIITEENGEVVSKRPDRVLRTDEETIVIDYKFGKTHAAHKKQVLQYMDLLETMKYPNVKGYLWYVEERQIVPVE
ncbi:DNA helicase [Bacteroidia bacterium]|nr:DNA helicase [Bacteroidia bacterium]